MATTSTPACSKPPSQLDVECSKPPRLSLAAFLPRPVHHPLKTQPPVYLQNCTNWNSTSPLSIATPRSPSFDNVETPHVSSGNPSPRSPGCPSPQVHVHASVYSCVACGGACVQRRGQWTGLWHAKLLTQENTMQWTATTKQQAAQS